MKYAEGTKFFYVLIVLCGAVYAQNSGPVPSSSLGQNTGSAPYYWKTPGAPHHYNSPEEYRFDCLEPLINEGNARRGRLMLMRMGDEAAADLLKILEKRPLLTESEQETVLDMIHYSFEFPRAVANSANRKPEAAVRLLQKLDTSALSLDVSRRAMDERQFILKNSSHADTVAFPVDTPNGPLAPGPPVSIPRK